MSQIITSLTCKHCNKTFGTYISFGHPDEDFVWKWKCKECENINEEFIDGMPIYPRFNKDDNKDECRSLVYKDGAWVRTSKEEQEKAIKKLKESMTEWLKNNSDFGKESE